MEDDNQTNTNVFLVSLPMSQELSQASGFGKNLTKSTPNDGSPVIIINPIFYSDRSNFCVINRRVVDCKCSG
jgi:hypothetical protein